MSIFNEDEFEVIQENDVKKDRTIIVSEIKDEQNKKTRNKMLKNIGKTSLVIVCCASIGFGAGAGFNISKNLVTKYEQSNFSFNTYQTSTENGNLLLTNSNNLVTTIKEASNSVVNITTTSISRGFFNNTYENSGSGSGIIYKIEDDKVYIITNNHVVEDATTVSISITGSEQISAKLVGQDASSDLAVIYVELQDFKDAGIDEVIPAKFGNSESVEVGEYVFPIGNALGEGKTVTQGIISAQNKEIVIDGKKLTVIQTDAAINPGNSGGALINTDGEVIGINTAKLSSSAIEGIGYAIPTNIAISVAEEIILNGSNEKPYFGIIGFTLTDDIKYVYNIKVDGIFVTEVEEGSSAQRAGLRATDIITSFNGVEIKTVEDLSQALSECKQGDTVEVVIIRSGVQEMTLTATLNNSSSNF